MTPDAEALRPLDEFLRGAFTAQEFRRFIEELSIEIADTLPGPSSSYAEVRAGALQALSHHGRLDTTFFQRLIQARPARREQIERLSNGLQSGGIDETQVAKYRAGLTLHLRNKIHLSDLDADVEDSEFNPAIDILELFIPQNASPTVARADFSTSPNSAVEERAVDPGQPVSELVTALEYPWILLLGSAGAGKTTLARWIALRLCGDEPMGRLSPDLVPVLVDLRHFAEQRPTDVFEYLTDRHKFLTLPLDGDAIRALAKVERVVWLFDGLDEIADVARRREVGDMIIGLRNGYLGRGIVTGRIASCREFAALLPSKTFHTFTLLDFDDSQIDLFLQRWHTLALPGVPELAERRREHLRRAMHDNPPLRGFARNPLLLSLLAVLNRGDELPRSRHEILQRAAELLIERWDTRRGIPSSARFRGDAKQRYLAELALHMLVNVAGGPGNIISRDDLRAFTEHFCTRRLSAAPSTASSTASTLIRQLRERNNILGFLGGNSYGFLHKAFLEYFAADEICHRLHAGQWTILELEQLFARRFHDPSWRETLNLVCDLLWQGNPDETLALLQRAVTATTLGEHGLSLSALALLVLCLREAPFSRSELANSFALTLNKVIWANYRLLSSLYGERPFMSNPVPMAYKAVGTRWPGIPDLLAEIDRVISPPALHLEAVMTATATYPAEIRVQDYLRRISSGQTSPTLVLAARLDNILSPTELESMTRALLTEERSDEEMLSLAVAILGEMHEELSAPLLARIAALLPEEFRASNEAKTVFASSSQTRRNDVLRLAAFALLRARPWLCEDAHILSIFRPSYPEEDEARAKAVVEALASRPSAQRDPFIAVTGGWLHSVELIDVFLNAWRAQPGEAIKTAALRICHWEEGLEHLRDWGRANLAPEDDIEFTFAVRINSTRWIPQDKRAQMLSDIIETLNTEREEPNWEVLDYLRGLPLLGLPGRLEFIRRIQRLYPRHAAEIGLLLLSSDLQDPLARTQFVDAFRKAMPFRPVWALYYYATSFDSSQIYCPEIFGDLQTFHRLTQNVRSERDFFLLLSLAVQAKRVNHNFYWRPLAEHVLAYATSGSLRLRAALVLEARAPLSQLQQSSPTDFAIQAALDLFDARQALLRIGKAGVPSSVSTESASQH